MTNPTEPGSYEPLDGRSAMTLPPDDFDRRFNAACAYVIDRGTTDDGRMSLAAAYLAGLIRYLGQAQGNPLSGAPLPGWLVDDPNPWVLVIVGFMDPDEPVPDDPGVVHELVDHWLARLDEHGANDRAVAFNDAVRHVANSSNPHHHNPAAAVLLEAAEDPLCLEPLPRRLAPGHLVHGGTGRYRPHPAFELPKASPPSSRFRRMLTGDLSFPEGTFGNRLVEGIARQARLGAPLKERHSAALLSSAVALGYHTDVFDGPDEAHDWAWATPHGTAASTFMDILTSLSEHDTVVDALRYADALDLFDAPDDADRLGPDLHRRASRSYGPRDRQVPRTDGRSIAIDDPDHQAEMRDVLREQRAAFEAKFGRPPGPDDPVFFDPDAEEPTAIAEDALVDMTVSMLEEVLGAGYVYAYLATDGLMLTQDNEHLVSEQDRRWFLDAQEDFETIAGLLDDGEVAAAYQTALDAAGRDLVNEQPDAASYLYQQLLDSIAGEDAGMDLDRLVGTRRGSDQLPDAVWKHARRFASAVGHAAEDVMAQLDRAASDLDVLHGQLTATDAETRWWTLACFAAGLQLEVV